MNGTSVAPLFNVLIAQALTAPEGPKPQGTAPTENSSASTDSVPATMVGRCTQDGRTVPLRATRTSREAEGGMWSEAADTKANATDGSPAAKTPPP